MAFSCTRRTRKLSSALASLAVFCTFVFMSAPAPPARADVIYIGSRYLLSLRVQFDRSNREKNQEIFRRREELFRQMDKSRRSARSAADAQAERRRLQSAVAALPKPADKVERRKWYQDRIKRDLGRVRAANPGLSKRRAMDRLAFGRQAEKALVKFRKALAPAPMFVDHFGFYFHGNIVEYIKGLHRVGKDPDSYDQMVFRAYGRNGGRKSRGSARISARYAVWVYHDYDTPNDFVWRFSNRHELLKAPFGSTRHRQSIYALFDGDGEMGLSGGTRFRFGRGLEEGLITRFLVEGVPPQDEQVKRLTWNRTAPYGFSDVIGDIVRQGVSAVAELRPLRLFLAMARARVYKVGDPAIGRLARHGAAILCTMALADPEIALGARRSIARRARRLGLGCYEGVRSVLADWWDTTDQSGQSVGVLPVENDVVLRAVLEFVLSEDVFRSYLGAEYQISERKLRPTPARYLHSESQSLTDELAEIGIGERARHAGTVRQKLATAALERMITTAPGKTPEDVDYNELQSRTHRSGLLAWANRSQVDFVHEPKYNKDAREDWVYAMFCRVGWGHGDDIIPSVKWALDGALRMIRDDEAGKLAASKRPRIAANLRLIAWMLKTARRGDRHEKKLLAEIEKYLDKVRQWAKTAYSDQQKVYRRFFSTLEAVQAAGGRCS